MPTPTYGCPDLYAATTMTTTTGSLWTTWTSTETPIRVNDTATTVAGAFASPAEFDKDRIRAVVEQWYAACLAAEVLLKSCLSEEQRRNLAHRNFFEVISSRGRLWRIWRGKAWNVRRGSETWCASPRVDVPDADAMLAQKLWLETDEDAFCRVGNMSRPLLAAR